MRCFCSEVSLGGVDKLGHRKEYINQDKRLPFYRPSGLYLPQAQHIYDVKKALKPCISFQKSNIDQGRAFMRSRPGCPQHDNMMSFRHWKLIYQACQDS